MREVLIEVTKTLSEMEERENEMLLSKEGGNDSQKTRMSFANKKMLESARNQETNLQLPKNRK
jgi:hypothetical protein